MRTRTIAYLRVSTDKQADHGVSLDAQRAKARAYADLFDLEIVGVEVDAGESAKSLARPALQRALASLKRGEADAILVVKLDRLTRSVRDLCDLVDTYFRDGRWSLLSVGEQIDTRSAAGRMLLSMLTVIGQWEREACGERTATALAHLAAQGKRVSGAIPYGQRLADDGETLLDHDAERAAIVAARELRAAGMSLRAVATTLALRGVRARSGRPFAPSAIAAMVAA